MHVTGSPLRPFFPIQLSIAIIPDKWTYDLRTSKMGMLKMADNIKLFYTKCCPLWSIKLWTLWWTHCIFMPISTADHTIYHCSFSAQSDLWFHSSVSGRLSISSYDVTRLGRCRGDRRLCRVFSFIQSLCSSYCAHTVLQHALQFRVSSLEIFHLWPIKRRAVKSAGLQLLFCSVV